jgi:hypothetical protein
VILITDILSINMKLETYLSQRSKLIVVSLLVYTSACVADCGLVSSCNGCSVGVDDGSADSGCGSNTAAGCAGSDSSAGAGVSSSGAKATSSHRFSPAINGSVS